ncbi:Uncharacterised protein [Mycobacteroides abscessus subsp. abscessus]|nr:Uncharacterised protein [Mycobacteroides abscessus subsp. abscessus]
MLDAEVAVLTATAEDYFTDDTLDADVAGLLAPHAAALDSHRDPRVGLLAARCRDLADEMGLQWDVRDAGVARREDYALAAGAGDERGAPGTIAMGTATIAWSDVPPGIFDAAEHNLDWAVVSDGATVTIRLRAAICGPDSALDLPITLHCGVFQAIGVLDAEGAATLPVLDTNGQPAGEMQAWNADWSVAEVSVGAGRAADSSESRDRVRRFARARLAVPPADAFLAELLAAESDY